MGSELWTGSSERFRLSSVTACGRTTVAAIGEVDLDSSPQLSAALDVAVSDGADRVDVDFSRVTFCDCAGLNALLAARCRCWGAGVVFGVFGPVSPVVLRLFRVTEVIETLPVR
ncbi:MULTISPECIES: STAS domain-containing protein [Streptomyces]|uniref:STAS domain-containing protein n=1 Tax=Streptomyces silvisoli TaxID=3034235 RepID=A0ABT5ZV23_9ACTN|nr:MULTISPECIES: STAS domain-containing protein [Streptomyces]MDF3293675.1 STAS domain-containing protein [Streptomyces silvisoli]